MSLFEVDTSKCKKDHICAAVCPLGLIEKGNGVPVPIKGAEELCVSCGHCVAACPTGAMSNRAMKPEQCTSIKPELSLKPEQAEQFLRGRRSIRAYKTDPVDRNVLSRLVGLASSGPSGHNTQPVEWLVIHDTAEVRRLSGFVIDWMRFTIKQNPEQMMQKAYEIFGNPGAHRSERIQYVPYELILTPAMRRFLPELRATAARAPGRHGARG